jgi:hypothetical protein
MGKRKYTVLRRIMTEKQKQEITKKIVALSNQELLDEYAKISRQWDWNTCGEDAQNYILITEQEIRRRMDN